jgi:uncharacterized membrane protein YphA (DoxX/SURF4 family)
MALEDIGSLLIRVSVGWLFLGGAWACSKDTMGHKCAVADTALVFKWRPELFALLGIFMAGAGGLSVLFGIFPRLGALALTIFLVPAAMIHLAKRRQALALKEKILAELTGKISFSARNDLDALGASAAFGHYTAALKNLSLIGPTAYLVLAGARPPMLIGFGSDGQLHGLLTQF